MIPKSLPLAIYESSLLSGAGIPLVTGWEAILKTHTEPEVVSLFTDLAQDTQSGQPSLKPFEKNLPEKVAIASYFAELAANTTLYERYWSDMALAFLLKMKLEKAEPTEADQALARYLVSFEHPVTSPSFKEEVLSWSNAPIWKTTLEESAAPSIELPDEWWETFAFDQNRIEFPPTITTFLRSYLESGMLDSLPKMTTKWNRFLQASEQV